VAVIAGANSGLGSELCARLVRRGFDVAALGREAALVAVARDVPSVMPIVCDFCVASEVDDAFGRIEAVWGTASVVVYNAHRIELCAFEDTSPELFEESWRANCYGAFIVAQRALPAMLRRGGGTIMFSGATGSVRGGRRATAFSSSKFALRGLAQSLAREHAGSGVRAVHVVLDGLIWSERTRGRFNPEERDCMSASAVAESYVAVIEQDRSAWTSELDLRPIR
jgi:NAD(P)-dependent dehydrogenase (short-subunit alcohol dehydrogenase family)